MAKCAINGGDKNVEWDDISWISRDAKMLIYGKMRRGCTVYLRDGGEAVWAGGRADLVDDLNREGHPWV